MKKVLSINIKLLKLSINFTKIGILSQLDLDLVQHAFAEFFDDIVDRSGLLVERLDKIFEFEYFRLFLLWIRALEY
jgi:hypothetical protein